jgi:hypothetical protein
MRGSISQSIIGKLTEAEVPVPFWKFAVPIVAGSVAGRGAAYLVKNTFVESSPRTQETASIVAGIAAFWIVAGGTWIALSPKRGA